MARDAGAYGKHGKQLRWKCVELAIDHGWDAARIHAWLTKAPGSPLISLTCVKSILKIYDDTGDVRCPRFGKRNRHGIISEAAWQFLSSALERHPELFLDEMQSMLRGRGIDCHVSTICRTLQRKGWSRVILQRINTNRDIFEEIEFRQAYQRFPASTFVYVDETKCAPRGLHRKRGYGPKGSAPGVEDDFQSGVSYSATCAFTMDGVVDCFISDSKGVSGAVWRSNLRRPTPSTRR